MNQEAFIHIRKNGSVRVSDGLVFCRGMAVLAEDSGPIEHEIDGNTFITEVPKWWQVFRWLTLVRTIRAFMSHSERGN